MDRLMRFPPLLLLALLATTVVNVGVQAATPLTKQEIGSGFIRPVFVTAAPGDTSRLFVVGKGGTISIVKNGSTLPTAFLDITDRVRAIGSEQGLLGLAFHPNYPMNGFFYVNYTDSAGDTHIARFSVTGDPDVADPSSEFTIVGPIEQPFSNHNAGMLAFSPLDGYLYFGLGDGGSGGDPGDRAQTPTTLLGKLIRIDVDGGSPYAIPPDNPFVGTLDTLPEIWALGVRNPWRWSFDLDNGDMYIGEVGQSELEEIDYEPGGSAGGRNYGWRLKEGTSCYNPPTGCETLSGLTDPIYEYTHGGTPFRCSITGGVVYRGCAVPDLVGTYFFSDYCSGQIWTFAYDGNSISGFTDRSTELGIAAGTPIVSFGQDNQGEVYIIDYDGHVYKVVPDGVASACSGGCCLGISGNVDGDLLDQIVVSDLTYLVSYLFSAGPAPACTAEGNVDGIGAPGSEIDVSDVTFLVAYLFMGGPAPPACP